MDLLGGEPSLYPDICCVEVKYHGKIRHQALYRCQPTTAALLELSWEGLVRSGLVRSEFGNFSPKRFGEILRVKFLLFLFDFGGKVSKFSRVVERNQPRGV